MHPLGSVNNFAALSTIRDHQEMSRRCTSCSQRLLLLLLLLDGERTTALVVGSALAHVGAAPARAHAPQMGALSRSITASKAAVAAVGAFGLWFRRIRSLDAAKQEFADLQWADAPTDEELAAESCTVLGEEKDSGRVWYRCFDKSEGLECERDVSLGADSYVCKEPRK